MNSHTDEEKAAIRACAGKSDPALREQAIAAHRAMLARVRLAGSPPYGDPYYEFMREIDTPVPDLGLRARYRQLVLDEVVEAGPKPAGGV